MSAATPPCLLLTLGDIAGVGPEIVARAWQMPELHQLCRPVVVGEPEHLRKMLRLFDLPGEVEAVSDPSQAPAARKTIPCISATNSNLQNVAFGQVSAAAGQAAYDFLCCAIDLTVARKADGIVTLPLHKEGLHAAGLRYPGHTEILAERTGVQRFAMMLYFDGLGVTHVTLHMALRDIWRHLHADAILEKIMLTNDILTRLLGRKPRIAACGLNPHASDGGLFGDEEEKIISPAVAAGQARSIDVTGPWAPDTVFLRGRQGEFDGIIAMYHDQGHIALKLLAGHRAVNITLGLPIVRTSVAHGTAYDIAGQGIADPAGLIEAVRVASKLARAT